MFGQQQKQHNTQGASLIEFHFNSSRVCVICVVVGFGGFEGDDLPWKLTLLFEAMLLGTFLKGILLR